MSAHLGTPQNSVYRSLTPISANIKKWSNTLKQFVDKLVTNCLSVFDHFAGLALKGLTLSLLYLKETAKIVLITRQFQNL